MHKKASLLLPALLLCTSSTWAARTPFDDVPKKHWAYQALHSLAKVGLMSEEMLHGDYYVSKQERILTRYEFAVAVQRIPHEDRAHPLSTTNRKWIRRLRTEFRSELDLLSKQK